MERLLASGVSYAACVIILMRKIFEPRAMIIAGLGLLAIGAFFNLPITSQWQVGELLVGQLIQGVGLPMLAVPLIHMFVADVRPPRESPCPSVLNLIPRVLSGATIVTAWASTSLRLNSQGKFGELLTNTGFHPVTEALRLPAWRHAWHTAQIPCSRAQAVQIIAGAARRQAAVLGISDTFATLGWLLFASCLLVVLMAEFGSGRALRPREMRP